MKKSGTMSPKTRAWVALPKVFANAFALAFGAPPTTAADISESPTRSVCSIAALSCRSTSGAIVS